MDHDSTDNSGAPKPRLPRQGSQPDLPPQELVDVPLERPRNQVRTRNDPEFAHLRTHILELVTRG